MQGVPPSLIGVYGMGGGGLIEVWYRHYFEFRHLQRICRFRKDMQVLELGCGNGRWALSIAPLVGNYVGVDFSTSALQVAREQVKKNKLPNVSLIEKNIGEFMSPDTFDVIYLSGVSQYLTDEEFELTLAHIRACCHPATIIVDRSTINMKQSEIMEKKDYWAVFRTPAELALRLKAIGFALSYQKRSYRFLRGGKLLNHPRLKSILAPPLHWTRPLSFHLLHLITVLADALKPVPFEGGERSHDFFLFKQP
jgi:ubiquinone/menaquinone biosynthesis C-methylase UbiE